MIGIVHPSSESVFAAAAEPPKAEEWTAVENDAWMKWAIALRDKSEQALKAARAKDADALAEAGDQVYETCEGYHKIHVPGAV